MTDDQRDPETIRTLIKYTLIGVAAAFVVAYFLGSKPDVSFNEVSVDDAKDLLSSYREQQNSVISYSKAVDFAATSVVNIYTTKKMPEKNFEDDPVFRRFFDEDYPLIPKERLETSLGSGVIISDQGYILTNHHVIQGADEIQVALKDGRNSAASVIGTDPESDIAVLKVAIGALPTITLGQSDLIQVGDVVLAIGNPFGVGQTVTMGIISATGRDRLGLSTFENFIQTDAAINPGNSGGALVNAFGHLIGINTAIFSRSGGSQGIGFAIPVNYAKEVTEQIIEHGHVIRGWLGIEIQGVTPALAESFGLRSVKGVIVAGVLRDGPADSAGMKPGDIIVEINGDEIADGKQALNEIAKSKPGSVIEIDVLRRGERIALKAKTAQRPLPKFN
ncbi:MAG: trypsin-like peptidase domain-containing protein [Gammaproteobacteria bacterium]|nr:trypsin-like peptidase domain-containing protein [Gammaproteobacteria bacterium]